MNAEREIAGELAADLVMLTRALEHGEPSFRVWQSPKLVVVVGRAVEVDAEVDVSACRSFGVPIVRRPSGGRSVVIGPGTLQYTFALPYRIDPGLTAIPSSKSFCNRLLLDALGDPRVRSHHSGDLVLGDKKVAGLAIKRARDAMLLHGTILMAADLDMIGRLLRHPVLEPDYRRGRAHRDFLANLGPVVIAELAERVSCALAEIAARSVEAG